MKALVTGSSGFVGRHLCDELERRGWDVVGIDLRERERRGCSVPGSTVDDGFLHGDVRNLFKAKGPGEDTRRIFGSNDYEPTRFDLVAHCAYHVGGRAAIDGNPSLLALNLELDAQLFDWAIRTRQHAVLYFSSSAAYPIALQEPSSAFYHNTSDSSARWISLCEDMIDLGNVRQPDARYGWAKLTGEQLANAATRQGLRVHVLRPFSGYGGDQDLTYPFRAVLQRVAAGDMSVWGSRGQYRDWIHIDDVVNGALAVYNKDCRKPVNLCSGEGIEFGELAVRMATAMGRTVDRDEVTYLADQPTGVMVRVGDPTRMREIYRPAVRLDEGIRRAIGELN